MAAVPQSNARYDLFSYRAAVVFLGLIVMSTVLAGFYLVDHKGLVSDTLISIGSTAVGALAGLLAPQPKTRTA